MATSNFMWLDEGITKIRYKLHPVVVFSILDHYKRRNESLGRVVGTLLGARDEHDPSVIYIRNCFPVRHSQPSEEQVVVDMAYHSKMVELHQKVNKKDIVLGWYSTGGRPDYISALIHEAYENELAAPAGPAMVAGQPGHGHGMDAVHVTVDAALTQGRLWCHAFTRKTVRLGTKSVLARFEPVSLSYNAYEAEKIGVEALINGEPDEGGLEAPARVLSDVESYVRSLRNLLKALSNVHLYTEAVVDGKVEGDVELGSEIRAALWSVPLMSSTSLDAAWNDSVQDMLMSVYLSNLTKAHIALADKINALLP